MQHNEVIEGEKPVDGEKGRAELGLYMELQRKEDGGTVLVR